MSPSPAQRSSKAVCVHQASGLMCEALVTMVNVDAILFDPSQLDAPLASHQTLGATSAAGSARSRDGGRSGGRGSGREAAAAAALNGSPRAA